MVNNENTWNPRAPGLYLITWMVVEGRQGDASSLTSFRTKEKEKTPIQ
jgi:hypothetical protein